MLGILQAGVRSTAGMAKFTEITSLQVLGFVAAAFLAVVCHAVEFPVSFDANFVVTSNGNHAQVLDGGQVVNLALVEYSSNRSFGPWSTLQPLIFCVIELWRCSGNFQSSDRNNLAGIEQEWVAFLAKVLLVLKIYPFGSPYHKGNPVLEMCSCYIRIKELLFVRIYRLQYQARPWQFCRHRYHFLRKPSYKIFSSSLIARFPIENSPSSWACRKS